MRTFQAVVLSLVIGFAELAHAGGLAVPDLTGTWTGKVTCKGIGNSLAFFGSFSVSTPSLQFAWALAASTSVGSVNAR